jgi:phage/plasmid-associated DNA primase
MVSNGKSILMNLLMLSFGDYCGKVNATTFTKESRGANETSELHACKASRLVVVEEPNENDKLISSRLKEYSGDTVIKTRGLHENAFSFEVMFCMIFFCNQICELSKVDNAIGRRLRLLNFPFKFCDNPVGDNEKLIDISWGIKISKKNEDCIYYKQAFMLILWENWCSKDFVNKKIDTPNEVMDITKKYMDGCNSVKLFVDEYCEIVEEKKERIPARDLYNKFKGIYPGMDERSFAYNMMEMGIEKKKFKTSNQYICIKYKDNDDSDSD